MKKVILGLIVVSTLLSCNNGSTKTVVTDSTKVDSVKVVKDTAKKADTIKK